MRELMEQGEIRLFSPGETIYSAHDFRRAIGVILYGKVQVHSPGGVLLNTLHPGSCFGVAALFHPTQRYVSTVTAQEESGILFYSGETLEKMFVRCPLTARNYISFLSQRIQFLNDKIGSFTAPTAQARLALWLLAHGPQPQVESYTQLSRELNRGRASLSRALDSLEGEGIIRRQGNCIHLCPWRSWKHWPMQTDRPHHITKRSSFHETEIFIPFPRFVAAFHSGWMPEIFLFPR